MLPLRRSGPLSRPSLALLLLGFLFASLWIAGGASRPDALGQAVVRSVAWATVVAAILFGPRSALGGMRPVLLFLAIGLGLALIQLVPLPPALWQALPGRALLADAASVSGQPHAWAQWSMVPGATLNAAVSLIVPFAVLLLLAKLGEGEYRYLPVLFLGFVVASMIVGLLQLSGAMPDNIFINETRGAISGTLANRNHFALLLAIGCVISPVWAVSNPRKSLWRMVLGIGLVLLFLAAILVTGSRAGLALGAVGSLLGFLISWPSIRKATQRYPRWVFYTLVLGVLGAIVGCVLLAVLTGRAVAIDRIAELNQGPDMRVRGLPVVLEMIGVYFPFGSGLGTFDPVFRMHEPSSLLKPTYFNHAHNDFLEVLLTAGLPGVLLLGAAVGWWAWASYRAWWRADQSGGELSKLGSVILLLIFIASIFDYPARTPTIMAVIVIASVWLSVGSGGRSSALPRERP